MLDNNGLFQWNEFKNHESIRKLISRIIPGFEPISNIGKTKKEFHIRGRILREANFSTASGKAKFIYHMIPNLNQLKENEFHLLTVRSEGQFNTVVYEEEDIYRGQQHRNVVLMNRKDMDRIGLVENDQVVVKSKTGLISNICVRPFDIKIGSVLMYYPEANILISQMVDPLSRTPAFKSTVVTIGQS